MGSRICEGKAEEKRKRNEKRKPSTREKRKKKVEKLRKRDEKVNGLEVRREWKTRERGKRK